MTIKSQDTSSSCTTELETYICCAYLNMLEGDWIIINLSFGLEGAQCPGMEGTVTERTSTQGVPLLWEVRVEVERTTRNEKNGND